MNTSKNYTQVEFKGQMYGKSHLVLAVITDFMSQDSSVNLTYDELDLLINHDKSGKEVYPLYSIIARINDPRVKKSRTGMYRRYHEQIFKSGDGVKFVVTNQWGVDNIDNTFINKIARKQLGYKIDNFTKHITEDIIKQIAKSKSIYGATAKTLIVNGEVKARTGLNFLMEIGEQFNDNNKATIRTFGVPLINKINDLIDIVNNK